MATEPVTRYPEFNLCAGILWRLEVAWTANPDLSVCQLIDQIRDGEDLSDEDFYQRLEPYANGRKVRE